MRWGVGWWRGDPTVAATLSDGGEGREGMGLTP